MPFVRDPQQAGQPYLPTFQEVMLTYDYEDSMRLPPYQARQLGRYHPYMRLSLRSEESSLTRYANTIYDEQCVFLEVPSAAPATNAPTVGITSPEAHPAVARPAPENPPSVPEAEQGECERHLGDIRVNRLSGIVMEAFLQGVWRAILGEETANAAPDASPEVQLGSDSTTENELDRILYGSVL